jgi:KDO2-lipid IV(A) lauroyltransferase
MIVASLCSRGDRYTLEISHQELLSNKMNSVTRDRISTDCKISVARRAANSGVMFAFRALLYICAVLPQRMVRFLASCVGWLAWRFNTRSRKITERNIAIAFPESPISEQRQLARASFRELYRCVADIGPSWLWSAERSLDCVSSIVGEEHLHAAVAEDCGVIVLLPHLGNWELLGPYLTTQYPVTTLYKEPKNSALNDIILRSRQRHGNVLVPANKSGVRGLLKALKSRELVVILPDQVPSIEGGEFALFFGEPALTMTLVSSLINRNSSKAVLAYALRRPDHSYQIVIRPVDEGIYSTDCSTALLALNKSIEQCVLDCPEQYQWEYKRYKYLSDYSRRKYY